MENLNNWKAILGDMNQWDQAAWDEWYALGEEWYYKYKADDQLFYEHMGGGTLEEVDTRFIAAWDYYESHDKSNSELFVPLIIMAILGAAEDDSSGFVPGGTQIHWGKQGKHIPGHNNYIPGRSIITHSKYLSK
ncbi:MAG: hypothetical protein GY796_20255, partial [Chloroflexi bacterium]|nr:hypothetical protein [Chloroflexota bacterium]